jgi:hypothetical protein
MIQLLEQHFSPDKVEEGYSLCIEEGKDGARLSHSHVRQYHYVLQSLNLWRAIINDFFKLWYSSCSHYCSPQWVTYTHMHAAMPCRYLADEDLLDGANPYSLKDTGQGLQRKQNSPRIYNAMMEILQGTQQRMGHWVGSSVVHIGDATVPNALVFIDKYTQVLTAITAITRMHPAQIHRPLTCICTAGGPHSWADRQGARLR